VVDVSLEHDGANNQVKVFLRANDFDFGGVLSNLVFTVRWPESSPATLGIGSSLWCPAPSQAFNPGPTTAVAPGNGYRYRTWSSVGLANLSEVQDDGGCDQVLLADQWIQVLTINVNNDPGGTDFIIADDDFTGADNRGFYVSLNGVPVTGAIYTFSTNNGMVDRQGGLLRIAPNPAHGAIRAELAGTEGPWRAELLDASGRSAGQWRGMGHSLVLDAGDHAAGRYTLRITTAEGVAAAPLVIQP
jgi:hypothetical protein